MKYAARLIRFGSRTQRITQRAACSRITPNQFNDMHTALTGGFTHNGTTFTAGAAKIAQGDNFLRLIVPQIMASQAHQNNGAIII